MNKQEEAENPKQSRQYLKQTKMKNQRVFILKKEEVERKINPWLQGSYPYNVKTVKELKSGFLFIVLTK